MAKKGVKGLFIKVIAGVNIAIALLMILTGYSNLVNPVQFSIASTLGLFFPIFLALNICFLVFWLFFLWRKAYIPVLALIICYFPVHTYIGINISKDVPEEAIKLMSYNVKGLQGYPDQTLSCDTNAIINYLCDENCDIVCLQESLESWLSDSCRSKLFKYYPYHQEDIKYAGSRLAIYSKYKILSSDTIQYHSDGNFSMYYILKIGKEEVYVINNHLETCHLSIENRKQFSEMIQGNLDNDSAKINSKSVIEKLIESAVIRTPQADAIGKFIDEHKDKKIILMGDFNDNPISYTHHTIAKQLTDCFVNSGKGPGWSYCHNAMRVRIDNIMCSKNITPYDCKVESNISFSDHYPIKCWVKFDR